MTAQYLKELCEENFIDYRMMREIRELILHYGEIWLLFYNIRITV